ncbi:hypothetical protein IWX81_001087 [Salinibacterium sp. CAN_S4]|uniref:PKD domain-containing protein n=1 Tax=Salinibacterium sp. CAN_S4 TaxID=2787727 RepID=UPI0018EFB745
MCGGVTAGLGDDDVTIGIDVNQPGSPRQPGEGIDGGGVNDPVPEDEVCIAPAPSGPCQGFGAGRDPFTITSPVLPITLSDIANFRPSADVAGMEPNGWMIVGLDTNFFADSTRQVVDGVLLGQPASVRFTPVAWRWNYGDGTSKTLSTPGASWAASGVAEFSPTSGSHIYRSPGTYVIDLSVLYAPEYRFGAGGWTPISGTLAVPSNRLTATAGNATTVLVERECTVNPRGPGC